MAYGKVTEETVYTCTGHPLRSDIANILDWSLNKDFTAAYERILHVLIRFGIIRRALCLQTLNISSTVILELKTLKGLALHDILTEVHLLIHRGEKCGSIFKAFHVVRRVSGHLLTLFRPLFQLTFLQPFGSVCSSSWPT